MFWVRGVICAIRVWCSFAAQMAKKVSFMNGSPLAAIVLGAIHKFTRSYYLLRKTRVNRRRPIQAAGELVTSFANGVSKMRGRLSDGGNIGLLVGLLATALVWFWGVILLV